MGNKAHRLTDGVRCAPCSMQSIQRTTSYDTHYTHRALLSTRWCTTAACCMWWRRAAHASCNNSSSSSIRSAFFFGGNPRHFFCAVSSINSTTVVVVVLFVCMSPFDHTTIHPLSALRTLLPFAHFSSLGPSVSHPNSYKKEPNVTTFRR